MKKCKGIILEMLKAFDKLGRDPMARIDARIWVKHFRRKIEKLKL